MESGDSRHIARESMFLMADLRLEGTEVTHRVKVRNLSNGGMMAECPVRVAPGAPVEVSLRNIGWVEGIVAWVQESRFGIAFRAEVDARLVRLRTNESESIAPHYVRSVFLDTAPKGSARLRKI